MSKQLRGIRFRLAEHIRGEPLDPPRWAEEPRLRRKTDLPDGMGTKIAILDSGISRHPWLHGSYAEPPGLDAVELWDLSADPLPRHIGHGTFVSGVVLHYAPQATLIPRRVIDMAGHADDAELAAVIDSLRPLDPDVLNLSLAPEAEAGAPDEGTSLTLQAIRTLQDECGTVVVVAAGNDGETFPTEHLAPDDDLTVVVGALDLGGRPAWFSNRQFVTIWAPGVDVLSSFVHWDGPIVGGSNHHSHDPAQQSPPVRPTAPFTGWARWNGTSFAAPAVAGAVAAEISRLCHVADRKVRRQTALGNVLEAARDVDVDGEKGKMLAAVPVALQGPPAAEHPGWR